MPLHQQLLTSPTVCRVEGGARGVAALERVIGGELDAQVSGASIVDSPEQVRGEVTARIDALWLLVKPYPRELQVTELTGLLGRDLQAQHPIGLVP